MIFAVSKISRSVLNAERLKRTVPVSSVPADSCASGAQCSPARTQTPSDASRAASVSQSVCAAHTESVPLCISPVNSRRPGISSSKDASSFRRRSSCASSRCGVCCRTNRSPAASPQMPQTFCVRPRRGPAAPAAYPAGARRCRCRPPEAYRASARTGAVPCPAGRRAPYGPACRQNLRRALPDLPAAAPLTATHRARTGHRARGTWPQFPPPAGCIRTHWTHGCRRRRSCPA